MAQPLSIRFASDCAFAASCGYDYLDTHQAQYQGKMQLKTLLAGEKREPGKDFNTGFGGSAFDNYFNMPGFHGECFVISGASSAAERSSVGFVALGMGQRENEALVAFRGSDLNGNSKFKAVKRDLCIDCAAAFGTSPKGFSVHGGFAAIFKSCIPELKDIFRRLPYIHTVHCVGHSMGGALATLAAEYFIDSNMTPYLYSFGAPRVGTIPHTVYMTSKMGDRLNRYYFYGDVVTWLPTFPYTHLPGKRLIYNGFTGSHSGYKDTKHLILAGGGKKMKRDARAEAEALINSGENAGGGYGLESRAFRYFILALQQILRIIGTAIIGSIIVTATVVDQVVAALYHIATRGGGNKPLVLRWITGAFRTMGKIIKSVTIDLIPNLKYLLNIMLTKLHSDARRELNASEQYAQRAKRGRRVVVRNINPSYYPR